MADLWQDNVNGNDSNSGLTKALAVATFSQINTIGYSGGDTLTLVDNGPTNPYREVMSTNASGTSGNRILITPEREKTPFVVASENLTNGDHVVVFAFSVTEPNEIYVVSVDGSAISPEVETFAASTWTEWINNGFNTLTLRVKAAPGSLAKGQWGWGNNDSLPDPTLYYRLTDAETADFSLNGIGVSMEMGVRTSTFTTSGDEFITVQNFKTGMSNNNGIQNSSGGNNNTFSNCWYFWLHIFFRRWHLSCTTPAKHIAHKLRYTYTCNINAHILRHGLLTHVATI